MASDKVNYREVGVIAQAIKATLRGGEFWDGMGGSAKESLDQIATAIARMVAGDGTHWDAIIGLRARRQARNRRSRTGRPSMRQPRPG